MVYGTRFDLLGFGLIRLYLKLGDRVRMDLQLG